MTDEQIEQLLKETEQKIWWHNWREPLVLWGITLASTLGFAYALAPTIGLIIGGAFCIPSVVDSKSAFSFWRKFRKAPTVMLWREATRGTRLLHTPSSPTQIFCSTLADFYLAEGSAEVLPLVQGMRLLSIYDLQQRRQQIIRDRITQLHAVRDKLRHTLAQLERLGEARPDAVNSVHKVDGDIAPLERLIDELSASCLRLEAIVASAQRAFQVRQLHLELTQLQSNIPSDASARALSESSLTDIERQISREIDTYLQLERETNDHLRDV